MLNEKKRHLDQAIQAVYHNYFYSLLPRMLFPGDITEAYRLFLLLLYLFRPIRRNPSMDFEYADLKSCFQSPNSS